MTPAMKNLHTHIDKDSISGMPPECFEGRIIVVRSAAEAAEAVKALSRKRVVGIDTETKPSFRKGVVHKVALLQVATRETCFLFRLNFMGLCEPVAGFLGSESTLKVGLSLRDDIARLRCRESFKPGRFLDLQDYVRQFGIKDLSLQKIYANVFGRKISKAQRLTNWEAGTLTEKQKRYAATDAWACLMLYKELGKLGRSRRFALIETGGEAGKDVSPALPLDTQKHMKV